MLRPAPLLILALSAVLTTTAASAANMHYGLTISTDTTYNVSFSNGVFAATGDNAILNITDLEAALQQGDTEVTTGNGSGGDEMGDLHIETPLFWNMATATLTLDAYHSIFVDAKVSDQGAGGMSIVTNDGGSAGILSIGLDPYEIATPGRITFANLSDALSINGTAYTLVRNVKTLAAKIAANPSGAYALAANYAAYQDGTYSSAPISTTFTGNFEGLGNEIRALKIRDTQYGEDGLFADIEWPGTVSHLALRHMSITTVPVANASVGEVAAVNGGSLLEDLATGTITVSQGTVSLGGLVGVNAGTIDRSSAGVAMTFGTGLGEAGGLVGVDEAKPANQYDTGAITNSHATGNITAQNNAAVAGGLVGALDGATIATSYATGNITCDSSCNGGGLLGQILRASVAFSVVTNSYATGGITHREKKANLGGLIGVINYSDSVGVAEAYSTGAPKGVSGDVVGGFVGSDRSAADSLTSCYWDTDTSGITNLSQGAGNRTNDPGITGQTTTQLQSGLPQGFDSAVWAESKTINGGLPYLKFNQPAQ